VKVLNPTADHALGVSETRLNEGGLLLGELTDPPVLDVLRGCDSRHGHSSVTVWAGFFRGLRSRGAGAGAGAGSGFGRGFASSQKLPSMSRRPTSSSTTT